MVIGTAGHIDHGKTALVRALTGTDTDRLPEEKRRGITIELGFAALTLPDGRVLGVVDVPGHEAFVRAMVAGASGIDLALLVVAADQGVMPQTREHLAILDLLGVRVGVVALTKSDLVEDEWLQLVEDDVERLLAGTTLENSPIVPVSSRTGEGLDALIAALSDAVSHVSPATDDDVFRLPVDRVFTLKGTGTVVTGTVLSGRLTRGTAWIHPPGRAVRVRELQNHGVPVDVVSRGMRAAVALADVAVGDVPRGATLVGEEWEPTQTLRCTLYVLDDARSSISARTRIHLHLGSADVPARVVPLAPGFARLHLSSPVLCRAGDRFVIRGGPRLTTLGGGTVIDPYSRRRARAPSTAGRSPRERLIAFSREAGISGVEMRSLPIRLGVVPDELRQALDDPQLTVTRERVYLREVFDVLCRRILEAIDRAHATDSLAPGASLSEVRDSMAAPGDLFDAALARLAAAGELTLAGAHVHRMGWRAQLDRDQTTLAEQMMHAFCATDLTTDAQILESYGPASQPVLRYLEREGSVVRWGDAVVAAPVATELIDRLRGHMVAGRRYTPAELREALGVSRKVLIPLLEYCDRVRVTERYGSERSLRG